MAMRIKSYESSRTSNPLPGVSTGPLATDSAAFKDGSVNFAECLDALFHEQGHQVQYELEHRDSEDGVHLKNNREYYYETGFGGPRSNDVYKLQPLESHAFFMGAQAAGIVESWTGAEQTQNAQAQPVPAKAAVKTKPLPGAKRLR